MSRLTRKTWVGDYASANDKIMFEHQEEYNKLGKYEDTGLTPEEVKEMAEGLLMRLPVKQYQTIYYILDERVYVGWYLAPVGESTHLILQDRIEMGICWVTDGFWHLTCEEAEAALLKENKQWVNIERNQ